MGEEQEPEPKDRMEFNQNSNSGEPQATDHAIQNHASLGSASPAQPSLTLDLREE